jgi:Domain of unknown function
MNLHAQTLAHLFEVKIPEIVLQQVPVAKPIGDGAPVFVREVLSKMIAGHGDQPPVSAFPRRWNLSDGHIPLGETEFSAGSAGVGAGYLYPVRQMCPGVSACGHSQQSLRAIVSKGGAALL